MNAVPELDPVEARVVACLVEKEITTPEYYPLTLNALVSACNQKSNRNPAVAYDEESVQEALEGLRAKGLASVLTGGGNRVPKFSHRLQERLNLGRREVALVCELLLRGPQTTAELRERASRMHRFGDVEEVETCLRVLSERGLARKLPRQTGNKEQRHVHLLCGEPVLPATDEMLDREPQSPSSNGNDRLEQRVARLEEQIVALENKWVEFRRQFD
jgi:uncharacterized protein YceH (UPF0502 family)